MDEVRTTSNRYDFMAVVLAKFDFMVDAESDVKVGYLLLHMSSISLGLIHYNTYD